MLGTEELEMEWRMAAILNRMVHVGEEVKVDH